MVTIEYRVQPDKRAEFVAAMQAVREMRRRNGAYFWELFHESSDPARYVECFIDESWLEHLRQHERASVADREILDRAKVFMRRRRIDQVHPLAGRPASLTSGERVRQAWCGRRPGRKAPLGLLQRMWQLSHN